MTCCHGKTNKCKGDVIKNNLCKKHICKEVSCDNTVHAKNLCKKHYNHDYGVIHRDEIIKHKKEYHTRDEVKQRRKIWNSNNWKRRKVEEPEKIEDENDRYVTKLRNEIFLEYSKSTGLCSCCKAECELTWDLDHADESGKASRKKHNSTDSWYSDLRRNGFPDKGNLTVMCCNCNQAKQYVDHRSSDHNLTKYFRNLQRGPKRWWRMKATEHKVKLEVITAYCQNTKNKFRAIFQHKKLTYDKWLESTSGKYVTSVIGKDLCCDWCNESWFDFLSLNHVEGGGNKDRKENLPDGGKDLYSFLRARDFPDENKWNVLCHNCQRLDKKTRERVGNHQIQNELF